MVKVRKDMTGWVLSEHGMPNNRITVLKQTDDYIRPDGRHEAQWICQCSCGSNPFVAIGHNLTAKVRPILSCGCLLPEVILNIKKKQIFILICFLMSMEIIILGMPQTQGVNFILT